MSQVTQQENVPLEAYSETMCSLCPRGPPSVKRDDLLLPPSSGGFWVGLSNLEK